MDKTVSRRSTYCFNVELDDWRRSKLMFRYTNA
jgi:hypothetical protein